MRILPGLKMKAWLTCLSELRVTNLAINVGGKHILYDVSSFGGWGSICSIGAKHGCPRQKEYVITFLWLWVFSLSSAVNFAYSDGFLNFSYLD